MISIRRSKERGHFDHGWLNTYHTFSFDQYYDPRYMGFRSLRVINEDFVAAGRGFPKHGHRDMEIITYILEGALKHEDSMGNGSVIRPGDVQRMSAGTGVRHSEQNASLAERVHLLQIWVLPDTVELEPSYEQKAFTEDERRGQLRLIASEDGRDGSVTVHQDVRVYATDLNGDERVEYEIAEGRRGYVHVARGSLALGDTRLGGGDAAKIEGPARIVLTDGDAAEALLFDLP
jgi:redox-sensitive bicupin YhaK (pirin superfamily)